MPDKGPKLSDDAIASDRQLDRPGRPYDKPLIDEDCRAARAGRPSPTKTASSGRSSRLVSPRRRR